MVNLDSSLNSIENVASVNWPNPDDHWSDIPLDKGSFQKKTTRHMENSISWGGVSEGSFSICYNDTFKMHKKPF